MRNDVPTVRNAIVIFSEAKHLWSYAGLRKESAILVSAQNDIMKSVCRQYYRTVRNRRARLPLHQQRELQVRSVGLHDRV